VERGYEGFAFGVRQARREAPEPVATQGL